MSLPIGNWSWSDRWVCEGDEDLMPYDNQTNSAKLMSDPNFSKPADPKKIRHPSEIPSSVYNETYRSHDPSFKHTTQQEYTAKMQAASKAKAMAATVRSQPNSLENFDSVAHSTNLWSRTNPAFYPMPYETESGKNYVDHGVKAENIDKTHFLKFCSVPPAPRNPVNKLNKNTTLGGK